ncbi:MAG: hypothetical protein EAZ62_09710 [Sphingobacteriia bacterium]|nr:MAG: hypothetical protein EAZ62_09710 [Sphingobacteriia bacterium]
MRGFFKIVFATLLALILFTVIGIFVLIGLFANAAASVEKPSIGEKAVLVLDLSKPYPEQYQETPFSLFNKGSQEMPSLYEVSLLLQAAKKDSAVKGLLILAGANAQGFAASEELRQAVADFKSGGKFVMAHAEVIGQKAYYVAAEADKIICHPQGGLEWTGFSANLFFLKSMLDKLEIEPQIFYAGKFKSATEPLREKKMTDANREQTRVWLGELYDNFFVPNRQGPQKRLGLF